MQSRIGALVLLMIILVISFSSCNSEILISGEVFVVTKGGQSLKLGLVDVMLFAEADVQQYLDKKNNEAVAKNTALKKEYDTAKAKYDDINKKYLESEKYIADMRESDSRYEESYSKLMTTINEINDPAKRSAELDRAKQKKAEYQKQHEAFVNSNAGTSKAEKDSVEEEKKNAEKKWLEWSIGGFFYQDLPMGKIITKATTDADGKFTLKLNNPGKYLVVAKSQRDVIGSTEIYYWFVWLSSDVENKHIMLTNNNLLGTDATEVAIKIKNTEKN